MKVLLDTHVYTWSVLSGRRLSRRARQAIQEAGSELLISAVVPWELATKWRLGKWPDAPAVLHDLEAALADRSIQALPITLAHAREAGLIRSAHRDPFDRILAAQARIEQVPLVTADREFNTFEIETIW